MEAMTLATLLTDIGSIFTSMMTWLGALVTVICENPLLLIFSIATFALVVVGVFRRLINI